MRRFFAVFLGVLIVAAIGCGGVKKQTKAETTTPAPGPGPEPKPAPPRPDVVPEVIGRSPVSHAKFEFQKDKETGVFYLSVSADPTTTAPSAVVRSSYFRVFKPTEKVVADLSNKEIAVINAVAANGLVKLEKGVEVTSITGSNGKGILKAILSDSDNQQMGIALSAKDEKEATLSDAKQDPSPAKLNINSPKITLTVSQTAGETDVKADYLPREDPKFPSPGLLTKKQVAQGEQPAADDLKGIKIVFDKSKPGVVPGVFFWTAATQKQVCFLVVTVNDKETEIHAIDQEKGVIDTSKEGVMDGGISTITETVYKNPEVACRILGKDTGGDYTLYLISEIRTKVDGTVVVTSSQKKA
ncbi:MAG TPA: hypothetical protein VI895_06655 [Bdellovibrionota bacterium]|nr:hypothetical protein [Bdellovibrionota bacterium]